MRLIPRNTAFFDDFDRHTALLVSAADTLSLMIRGDGGPASDLARKIKETEEAADTIVHRVVVELRKTFITPLDRDDTHRLISCLDDVLDQIESVAYRLALYRLPLPNRHLSSLGELVKRSAVGPATPSRTCARRTRATAPWSCASRSTSWRTRPTARCAWPWPSCSAMGSIRSR